MTFRCFARFARAKSRHELCGEQIERYRFQFHVEQSVAADAGLNRASADFNRIDLNHWLKPIVSMPAGRRVYVSVDLDVSRRANYLVNEIKLEWTKGRAVVRIQCYPVRWWARASGGTVGRGKIIGGKGMSAGIRLANAFISIRRGRVTCSPLRSISSMSFARSLSHPPSTVLFSTSLPFPFAFCFHFFSHLLVISLSLFLSVFRFVSFFLRISLFTLPFPPFPFPPPLSISLIPYSYFLPL